MYKSPRSDAGVRLDGGESVNHFSHKLTEQFITEVMQQDFLDTVVVWIGDRLLPEEVFNEKQLEDWAFDNGFRKFE